MSGITIPNSKCQAVPKCCITQTYISFQIGERPITLSHSHTYFFSFNSRQEQFNNITGYMSHSKISMPIWPIKISSFESNSFSLDLLTPWICKLYPDSQGNESHSHYMCPSIGMLFSIYLF